MQERKKREPLKQNNKTDACIFQKLVPFTQWASKKREKEPIYPI